MPQFADEAEDRQEWDESRDERDLKDVP